MSNVMERPDAADRRHDTLSKHQELIRAVRVLPERAILTASRSSRSACRQSSSIGHSTEWTRDTYVA